MGISAWQIVVVVALGVLLWIAFSRRSSRYDVAKDTEGHRKGNEEDIDEAVMESKNKPAVEAEQTPVAAGSQHDVSINIDLPNIQSTSDERDVQQFFEGVETVVTDYANLLANCEGLGIWDVKYLPYKKEVILDAICLWIMVERDAKVIDLLKTSAIHLADFQEGVGEKPIILRSLLGGKDFSAINVNSMNADEMERVHQEIQENFDNPDWDRYESYGTLIQREQIEILARVRKAEQQRPMTDEQSGD